MPKIRENELRAFKEIAKEISELKKKKMGVSDAYDETRFKIRGYDNRNKTPFGQSILSKRLFSIARILKKAGYTRDEVASITFPENETGQGWSKRWGKALKIFDVPNQRHPPSASEPPTPDVERQRETTVIEAGVESKTTGHDAGATHSTISEVNDRIRQKTKTVEPQKTTGSSELNDRIRQKTKTVEPQKTADRGGLFSRVSGWWNRRGGGGNGAFKPRMTINVAKDEQEKELQGATVENDFEEEPRAEEQEEEEIPRREERKTTERQPLVAAGGRARSGNFFSNALRQAYYAVKGRSELTHLQTAADMEWGGEVAGRNR